MAPKPRAETSIPRFPYARYCISLPFHSLFVLYELPPIETTYPYELSNVLVVNRRQIVPPFRYEVKRRSGSEYGPLFTVDASCCIMGTNAWKSREKEKGN
jgi:hypothetical protein